MSKSILYSYNGTAQAVAAAGTTINFGTIVRRYGDLVLSGGNPTIKSAGYYMVDTNIDFTPSAGGTMSIKVYSNGAEVPGAKVIRTVVADTAYAITIPAVVRSICCCETPITVVISGVAGSINNAAIVVHKL